MAKKLRRLRWTAGAEPSRADRARKQKDGQSKVAYALQISRLRPLPTLRPHPSIKLHPLPPSNKEGKKEGGYTAPAPAPHTPLDTKGSRILFHGASGPAVGRHGGRAAAGPRPRQAPQVRLLLPVLRGGRHDRRAVGRPCGAGRDAEHHHPPPAGPVRDVPAQRVRLRLRALVPGQRPRLPLRHSNDTQGRGLEQAAPQRQDGRRRGGRQPRHPQEPHRLRLGGDQFAGPLTVKKEEADPQDGGELQEHNESSRKLRMTGRWNPVPVVYAISYVLLLPL